MPTLARRGSFVPRASVVSAAGDGGLAAARPQIRAVAAPGPGVLSGVLPARASVVSTGRWRPVR